MKLREVLFVAVLIHGLALMATAQRVACVGDSITYGAGITDRLHNSGVDDYVSTDCVLNPAEGPFTVFAWIRGGQPGQVILSQSNEDGAGEVWLGAEAATGAAMTRLTDGGRFTRPLVATAVITDGAWHHVRLVWDGARRSVFVDGQEAAADIGTLQTLKSSRAGFHFGAGKNREPGSFWAGRMDDIRFYNRAIRP